jgi:hypothetical protein
MSPPPSTPGRCPCCGRRRRARAKSPRPAPLLDWIEREGHAARARRPAPNGAKLVLRHDLRDAAGEPRACLALPGHLPWAFASLPAALAALARMEAGPDNALGRADLHFRGARDD